MHRAIAVFLIGLAHFGGSNALADTPEESAAALRARQVELQAELRENAFGRPLYMKSSETANRLEGDLYAELGRPFAQLESALKSSARLCDILILHLNVKSCRPSTSEPGNAITLFVGPKSEPSLDAAYRMDYVYRIAAAGPDYVRILLTADSGPMGTSKYRIALEAVSLGADNCFVRFTYGYNYGTLAKIAMGTYLQTAGRSKVGFTVTGKTADGRPVYVAGVRGSVERNVMRYYLALIAYLSVTSGTPAEQYDRRLREWFKLTEQHARQLHEYDLEDYLVQKAQDPQAQPRVVN